MKGQVYKAKKRTKNINIIFSTGLLILIASVIIRGDLVSILIGAFILTFFVILWLASIQLTWHKVINRLVHLEKERFVFNFNRCLEHIERREFEKARQVYSRKILPKMELSPKMQLYGKALRTAYKAAKGSDLTTEYLQ